MTDPTPDPTQAAAGQPSGDGGTADTLKTLLPYLLAGGGGALVGGGLTAMAPDRDGESRLHRRYRILRNAALLAAAGVGGTRLLQSGVQNAVTQPLPASDKNPFLDRLHQDTSLLPGAGAAGVLGGIGIHGQVDREEQGNAANFMREHFPQAGSLDHNNYKSFVRQQIQNTLRDAPNTKDPGAEPVAPAMPGLHATDPEFKRYSLDKDNWQAAMDKFNAIVDANKARNRVFDPMALRTVGISPAWEARRSGKVTDVPHGWGNVLGEQAGILGQRVSGIGRSSFGKRLGTVGLAALIPALIHHYTEEQQQGAQ